MASILGQLLVELGINTAAFKAGLDKSTYQARQFSSEMKGSFGELGNSVKMLGAEFGNFGPASGIIDAVSASFKTLGMAVTGVGAGMAPISTLLVAGIGGLAVAAAAGAAGLFMLGEAGTKVVEELEHVSDKTGIAIRDLQTLKAAGASVDVPLEAMVAGFRKFEQALADSGKGAQAQQVILKSLGVTSHDPKEALLQVADAFSKIQDPTVRASDAVLLFGRTGLNMLPFLEKGRAGIKEYDEVVKKFGGNVNSEAVAATERWKKSTVELSTAWEGLKISAIGTMDGIGSKVTELLAKSAAGWGYFLGGKSGTGGAQAAPDKAKDAAADARQQAADKLIASQRQYFEEMKAGGDAAYALAKAQESVAAFLAADDYKDAAAIQAKIPGLEYAAKLERERRDALNNLPKNTGTALSEVAVEVTKAYAEALKGQTSASIEAAAAQSALATIEKFQAKGTEQGIATTEQFQAALGKVSNAASRASLIMEAFKAAGADNKTAEDFVKTTDQQTAALIAQSTAQGMLGDKQAAAQARLEPLKARLTELNKVYEDLSARYGTLDPEVQQVGELLERQTAAVNQATNAVAKYNAELKQNAGKNELQQEQAKLATMQASTAALQRSGEAYALVEEKVTAYAQKTGAGADAVARFRAALVAENAEIQKQNAIKLADPANSEAGQNMLIQIQQLKQMEIQWKEQGKDITGVHLALLQVNADYQNLLAKTQGMAQGAKAAFADFAASGKTAGQTVHDEVSAALTGITNNFAEMITTGKAGWQSLVDSMEEMLLKSAIQNILNSLFKEIGGFLSGQGGLLGGIGSAITPHAAGGDVTPGKTYLVGEKGPELLNIGMAGSIVPNGQFGGGGSGGNITVVQHIQTPDVDGFKRSQNQLSSMAYRQAATKHARMNS